MTATDRTPQLEWLDPRELVAHRRNVRGELGDLSGLTASIQAQGVLEPLVVIPTAAGHEIVAGHRRAAAATSAGLQLVPCVVRDDLIAAAEDATGQAEHVGAMLAENLHRQELSTVEVARGVQQMLDLGVNVAGVAKRTGLDRKRVALAAGVARLDESAAAAVAGLDLEQAAAVALYADDSETTATLVEAAEDGAGNFAHALSRAKQDREDREAYLAKVAQLQAAGRTLVDEAHSYGQKMNRTLLSLLANDGKELSAEAHADCPGSAVSVHENWDGPGVREVCTDFTQYGHIDRYASGPAKPTTPEGKDAAAAERRQLIEDNKAMAAANTTRRQWIRTALLERRRGEKDVLRFAVEAVTVYRRQLGVWLGSYQPDDMATIRGELGLQPPWKTGAADQESLTSGELVPDARLPLQLLAHVAAAIETTVPKDAHRSIGGQLAELATWLRFLVDQGYTLSEIEQRIVDSAAKAAA